MEDDEWALLDRKAMIVARLSLSKNIVLHKVKAKSTREMLDTLTEMYEKPSTVNKVHLMRWLFTSPNHGEFCWAF
ncbi:hypothetical protein ACS0TY_027216 [Phlomoides rotata]